MPLTIDDPETNRLVTELAELEGVSKSMAIRVAIRERLAHRSAHKPRGPKATVEDLLAIGSRIRALPDLDPRSPEEMLYDENGLPR